MYMKTETCILVNICSKLRSFKAAYRSQSHVQFPISDLQLVPAVSNWTPLTLFGSQNEVETQLIPLPFWRKKL